MCCGYTKTAERQIRRYNWNLRFRIICARTVSLSHCCTRIVQEANSPLRKMSPVGGKRYSWNLQKALRAHRIHRSSSMSCQRYKHECIFWAKRFQEITPKDYRGSVSI